MATLLDGKTITQIVDPKSLKLLDMMMSSKQRILSNFMRFRQNIFVCMKTNYLKTSIYFCLILLTSFNILFYEIAFLDPF